MQARPDDHLHLRRAESSADGDLPDDTVVSTLAYDGGLDRLTSVTSGVTVTRAYDSLSRLRSETTDGKTVQYGYDNASNLETLTYPSLVGGQPYQVASPTR